MTDTPDDKTAATTDPMARALAEHRAGRQDEAARLYRGILDTEPANADALHLLGLVARDRGRHDEALNLIEQALSIATDNAAYLNSQGAVLLDLGRPADAADSFSKAAAADPEDRGAWRNLAMVLATLERHAEAETALRRLSQLEPDDNDIRFRHGLALQRLGRMAEAAAAHEAVLAADPGHASAHANLAAALAADGDYDAAETHFRQALECGDGSAATQINLATMLHAGGRLDRAVAAFEDVLARAPDTAEAFIPLSAIVHAQGDPDRASRLLHDGVARKAHRTFPCPGTPAATVLVLRGLENSHYGLGKGAETVMTGGNFPVSGFLSSARFTSHVYHVLDGNICVAETPIPSHDVILNTIADADLEPGSLRVVAEYCEAHPKVPVINRPEAVMQTTRDAAYHALKDLPGVVFPTTVRTILPAAKAADFVRGLMKSCALKSPLLVRRVGTHTGMTLTRIDKTAQLSDRVAPFAGEEVYLIQYVDTSDAEGVFRKMRVYLIDGEPYPAHCFLNTKWTVHIQSRTAFMLGNPDAMDEEKRFMTDLEAYLGGTRMAQLRDTAAAIGIDFVGVDFTIDRDGQLFFFEYNPIMRHGFDFVDEFPYLEAPLQRLSRAFDDMVEKAAKADGSN